jgi:hypothetical protein
MKLMLRDQDESRISSFREVYTLIDSAQKSKSGKYKKITDANLRNILNFIRASALKQTSKLRFEASAIEWLRELIIDSHLNISSLDDRAIENIATKYKVTKSIADSNLYFGAGTRNEVKSDEVKSDEVKSGAGTRDEVKSHIDVKDNAYIISHLLIKICEYVGDDHTLNCEHVAKGTFDLMGGNIPEDDVKIPNVIIEDDITHEKRGSAEEKNGIKPIIEDRKESQPTNGSKHKNIFPKCFFGKDISMISIKQIKTVFPSGAETYERVQKNRGSNLIYSKLQIFTILQEKLNKRIGAGVANAIHGCLHALLFNVYFKTDDELNKFVSIIPSEISSSKGTSEGSCTSAGSPIYYQIQIKYMNLIIEVLKKTSVEKTIHLHDAYIACLHNPYWPKLSSILFE